MYNILLHDSIEKFKSFTNAKREKKREKRSLVINCIACKFDVLSREVILYVCVSRSQQEATLVRVSCMSSYAYLLCQEQSAVRKYILCVYIKWHLQYLKVYHWTIHYI